MGADFMAHGGKTCTIAVLGESGVGKSSVLNTLAQKNELFETDASPDSVTLNTEIKKVTCSRSGLHLQLIDTQGVNDTEKRDAEFIQDIQDTLQDVDSVHVFIFVINVHNARILQQSDALKTFADMLGIKFWSRLMFCFTHMSYSADDPKRRARVELVEKQKRGAVSEMMLRLGQDGSFPCIFLDNDLIDADMQSGSGDIRELEANIGRLYEFAMAGKPYSCTEVADDHVLMPTNVAEIHSLCTNMTRKKLEDFEEFIAETKRNQTEDPYLQYALINEYPDKLMDDWVDEVGEHGEHVYDLHADFNTALRRRLERARLDIFGAEYVQKNLRAVSNALFKRCPFCKIIWGDAGGCENRRCGHDGAPNLDLEYIPVAGRAPGCGRKFHWESAEQVSHEELKYWLTPHRLPTVKDAKLLTKLKLREKAAKLLKIKRACRQKLQAQRAAAKKEVRRLTDEKDAAKKEVRRLTDEKVAPRKGKAEEQSKCYLPNAVFKAPDGNFLSANGIIPGSRLVSVDGQEMQAVSISRHSSAEKQHIIEFITAQGNFKVSASHKIRTPDGGSKSHTEEASRFALAGHLDKGQEIFVGRKARRLDNVRREWTRIELIEIRFQPDLPVEMFMVKDYGLQTFGSDSSLPATHFMDTVKQEDLLEAQPDVYMD